MMARVLCLLALVLLGTPAMAEAPDSVFLEDFTWTELRDLIKAGKTTIIIPVGAVEQSGPAMALGKHDVRVKFLTERIARRLGNVLVAPVVSYVPEGNIDPPTSHMRFPGTISVPADVFRKLLASAAMSFRQAGFKDIVLLGDHGGYQSELRTVADQLNHAWGASGTHAHYLADYYRVTQSTFVDDLRRAGHSQAEIGTHAGLADTSLMMAVDPRLVRPAALAAGTDLDAAHGVYGDPRHASAELGASGINEIVNKTVDTIRAEVARP